MALCLAMIGFLKLNTATLSKMGTVPRVHLREASALWRVVIAILFAYGVLRSSWELVETCPWVPDRIGIRTCWFLRREKNRSTRRKTSRNKGDNQQQTQPMTRVEARNRTPATLVDRGEWFHHCAVLANSVNRQLDERTEERQWPIRSNQGCLFYEGVHCERVNNIIGNQSLLIR